MLASVENPRDILLARQSGYAAAVVVEDFPAGDKAYRLDGAWKTKIIPCPAETLDATCASCRLCLTPHALFDAGSAIAFGVHGLPANRPIQVRRPGRSK